MPHPKHRKQSTRQRILAAAATLFADRGFEATSIEAVMRACGLTRGGFYAHFRSKAELHAQAQHLALARPAATLASDWLDQLFTACNAGAPPSAISSSLALDVGSSTPEVRRGYARTFEQVCSRLQEEMAGSPHGEVAAQAVTAMLVGALAVSQTVDDRALSQRVAGACRIAAQALRDAQREPESPLLFFWSLQPDAASPALH